MATEADVEAHELAVRLLAGVINVSTFRPILSAALSAAREEGRKSVGLGDFVVDTCDDEIRSPYPDDYGWLSCSRRPGHDGEHENSETGATWARSTT